MALWLTVENEVLPDVSVGDPTVDAEFSDTESAVDEVMEDTATLNQSMDVAEDLEKTAEVVGASMEEGGLTPTAAEMVSVQLESARRLLGAPAGIYGKFSSASFESVSARPGLTQFTVERSVKQFAKDVWKKIKDFFVKLWDKIKAMWNYLTKSWIALESQATSLAIRAEKAKGAPIKSSFDNISLAKAFSLDGKASNETFTTILENSMQLVENSNNFGDLANKFTDELMKFSDSAEAIGEEVAKDAVGAFMGGITKGLKEKDKKVENSNVSYFYGDFVNNLTLEVRAYKSEKLKGNENSADGVDATTIKFTAKPNVASSIEALSLAQCKSFGEQTIKFIKMSKTFSATVNSTNVKNFQKVVNKITSIVDRIIKDSDSLPTEEDESGREKSQKRNNIKAARKLLRTLQSYSSTIYGTMPGMMYQLARAQVQYLNLSLNNLKV